MMPRRQNSVWIYRVGVLGLCTQLLSGCSGLDSLRIENQFAYPVFLRQHLGAMPSRPKAGNLGWILSGESTFFSGEGGYRGEMPTDLEIARGCGKKLGTLEQVTLRKQKEAIGGCNGSVTWYVVVGEKKKPLSEDKSPNR